jgi:signal transduction histidine kinase
VEVSQRAARKLERLIEDLLMFSRASHGEVSLRHETLDIRRIADRAIRSVAAQAGDAGIDLRLAAVDEIPPVQGDREKLLWALTHLLENAIKFTAPGGRIMLGLKPESTNLVMVSVRDTGIGIPPQHLQEIFEPFKQLDASARRRAGGTGLGLTLVRQIVAAHGSILEVRSVEGKGTTFKFPLLAAVGSAAPGEGVQE